MCRSITSLINLSTLIVFDFQISKIRTILIIVLIILATIMKIFHRKLMTSTLNIQLSTIKTFFSVKRSIQLRINSTIKTVFIKINNQINLNTQSRRRRLKPISHTKKNRRRSNISQLQLCLKLQ